MKPQMSPTTAQFDYNQEEVDWRMFLSTTTAAESRPRTRNRSQTTVEAALPFLKDLPSSVQENHCPTPLSSGRRRSVSDPSLPRATLPGLSYSCATSDMSRQYGLLLSSSIPVPILLQQRLKERKERTAKRNAKRKEHSATYSLSSSYSSSSSSSSSSYSSLSPYSSLEASPNLKSALTQSSGSPRPEKLKAHRVSSHQFPAPRQSKAAQILGESQHSHSSQKLSKLLGIDDAQLTQLTKKADRRRSPESSPVESP